MNTAALYSLHYKRSYPPLLAIVASAATSVETALIFPYAEKGDPRFKFSGFLTRQQDVGTAMMEVAFESLRNTVRNDFLMESDWRPERLEFVATPDPAEISAQLSLGLYPGFREACMQFNMDEANKLAGIYKPFNLNTYSQ